MTPFGEAWNDEVRKWGGRGILNGRFSAFFLFFSKNGKILLAIRPALEYDSFVGARELVKRSFRNLSSGEAPTRVDRFRTISFSSKRRFARRARKPTSGGSALDFPFAVYFSALKVDFQRKRPFNVAEKNER